MKATKMKADRSSDRKQRRHRDSNAEERVAGVKRQLEDARAALGELGYGASLYHVARVLGLQASTLSRWNAGETLPRPKQAEALAVLARLARYATQKPPGWTKEIGAEARQILATFCRERFTVRSFRDVVLFSSASWLVPTYSEM